MIAAAPVVVVVVVVVVAAGGVILCVGVELGCLRCFAADPRKEGRTNSRGADYTFTCMWIDLLYKLSSSEVLLIFIHKNKTDGQNLSPFVSSSDPKNKAISTSRVVYYLLHTYMTSIVRVFGVIRKNDVDVVDVHMYCVCAYACVCLSISPHAHTRTSY